MTLKATLKTKIMRGMALLMVLVVLPFTIHTEKVYASAADLIIPWEIPTLQPGKTITGAEMTVLEQMVASVTGLHKLYMLQEVQDMFNDFDVNQFREVTALENERIKNRAAEIKEVINNTIEKGFTYINEVGEKVFIASKGALENVLTSIAGIFSKDLEVSSTGDVSVKVNDQATANKYVNDLKNLSISVGDNKINIVNSSVYINGVLRINPNNYPGFKSMSFGISINPTRSHIQFYISYAGGSTYPLFELGPITGENPISYQSVPTGITVAPDNVITNLPAIMSTIAGLAGVTSAEEPIGFVLPIPDLGEEIDIGEWTVEEIIRDIKKNLLPDPSPSPPPTPNPDDEEHIYIEIGPELPLKLYPRPQIVQPIPPLTGDPEHDLGVLERALQQIISGYNGLTASVQKGFENTWIAIMNRLNAITNRLSKTESELDVLPVQITETIMQRLPAEITRTVTTMVTETVTTAMDEYIESQEELWKEMQSIKNILENIPVESHDHAEIWEELSRLRSMIEILPETLAADNTEVLKELAAIQAQIQSMPETMGQVKNELIFELTELNKSIESLRHEYSKGQAELSGGLEGLSKQVSGLPGSITDAKTDIMKELASLKTTVDSSPEALIQGQEDIMREITVMINQLHDLPEAIDKTITKSVEKSFQEVETKTLSFFDTIVGTQQELDFSPLEKDWDLTMLFPFCIPFDLIRMVENLQGSSGGSAGAQGFSTEMGIESMNTIPSFMAPKWEADILGFKWELDFAEYEEVAKSVRTTVFFAFVMALMVGTRRFIKW